MAYGIIKVDTITFTSGGTDVSIPISGLVQNPTFTGNATVTGTLTATNILGTTLVSGATVTGTAGEFGTLTGNTAGFTTITGATVTGTNANFVKVSGTVVTGDAAGFTTITGTTTTGTDANFIKVSGTTVTGNAIQGSSITGISGTFTTQLSGETVTGNTVSATSITGITGVFTTQISGASGVIGGNITASAFIPTGSGVPANGVYLPSANTVGIAANSSGILFATSSGVGIGSSTPQALLETAGAEAVLATNHHVTQYLTSTKAYNATPGGGLALRYKYNSAGDFTYGAGISFEKDNTSDGDFGSHVTLQTRPNGGSATERARIDSSGRLLVGVTSANANGGVLQLKSGITFPSTAVLSTDANTLDDYEEGTWTGSLESATPGTGRVTLNEAGSCNYVKIGKWVYVYGFLSMTTLGTGGSGIWYIQGLPFQSSNQHSAATIGYWTQLNSNVTWIGATVQPSSTDILVRVSTAAAAGVTNADFNTYVKQGTEVIFSALYIG